MLSYIAMGCFGGPPSKLVIVVLQSCLLGIITRKFSAGQIQHWVTTLNFDDRAGITTMEPLLDQMSLELMNYQYPTTFEALEGQLNAQDANTSMDSA